MSLLDEVMALAASCPPEGALARVELSQRQYDELRGIARQQSLTVPHTGPDAVFGVPVVVVDRHIPRPVLVYVDGREEIA